MSLPDGGFDGPIGDYLRNFEALDSFGLPSGTQQPEVRDGEVSGVSFEGDLASFINELDYSGITSINPTEGPTGTSPNYRWSVIPQATKMLLRRSLAGVALSIGSPEHALWSPAGLTDFQREAEQFTEAMDLLYSRGEVEKIAGGPLAPGTTRHIISFEIGQALYPQEDTRRVFLATIRPEIIQPSYYLNVLVKAVGEVNRLRVISDQPPIAYFPFAS